MTPSEELPMDAVKFVTNADTVFIGSLYKSNASTAQKYPSHAGMNSRGGLPGFIRISPIDHRTVIVPDYSGNRFLMSLGNIVSSGMASLTFVDFTTGDILYLTGLARVLVGPPALELMPRQACVIAVEVTGYIFVHDAFPMRQAPGSEAERSPYSPKIKYLAGEAGVEGTVAGGRKAQLRSAIHLIDDIAVFRFEVIAKSGAEGLEILPGQAIVLDFMDWVGPPQYRHMADGSPGSINDDRVRTWTVSSAHENQRAIWFEITMREMKGGAVTGALFDVLRSHPHHQFGDPILINNSVISDVVGITGDFFMEQGPIGMLWVAGGIGLTPFLSMLSALVERKTDARGHVVLALAAKDPDVFLGQLNKLVQRMSPSVTLRIDLFTSQENVDNHGLMVARNISFNLHRGRIPTSYWLDAAQERDVLICGPGGFGDTAVQGLRAAGVSPSKIRREGFY